MKLALLVAPLRLASAFVEAPPRGRVVGSPSSAAALRASPDDGRFETTRIRDVRDVVSGNVDDALDTRVPPPNGFENKTPMPMADESATPRRGAAPRKSQALPFAAAPAALDGTLAGDVGFDPLGFSAGFEPFGYTDSHDTLGKYREAEVKHGRLAMLAAAGWPLAELWDVKIARFLGAAPALNDDGRVPSVLNGGMSTISVNYWLGCLVLAAALDAYGSYFAIKKNGYVAGDLGFDPLGFYPRGVSAKDVKERERLRLSEIKHGRLAMLAITAFAAQEFATHLPVVDQTPVFFKPLWDVLNDQVPGYYVPPDEPAASAAVEAASMIAPEPGVAAAAEAASSAAAEAAVVVPDIAAPSAAETAAAIPVVPEVAAPAAAEAVSAAPEFAVPAFPEPATIAPPTDAADSLAAAPANAAVAEELTTAKARIVELETKLAQIDALTH